MSDIVYPILFSSVGALVLASCIGGFCIRRYMQQPPPRPPHAETQVPLPPPPYIPVSMDPENPA